MSTHRRERGGLDDDDAERLHPPHQLRCLRDQPRALLGGFLVGGDQQRDRHALGQRARSDDGGRDGAFHVGAAEAVQDAVGVETRGPGVFLPAGVGHRVHVAGQRDATHRAAMRHQRALRHAGIVSVVDALDVKARKCRFDNVGHREVGDKAAAVERHEVAGQSDDCWLEIGHWVQSWLPADARTVRLTGQPQAANVVSSVPARRWRKRVATIRSHGTSAAGTAMSRAKALIAATDAAPIAVLSRVRLIVSNSEPLSHGMRPRRPLL